MAHTEENLCNRYVVASSALQRGDWSRARREFERLTLEAPRFAPAWDGLARACDAEGDLKKAGEYYQKSIRLDRDNWSSRYHWGVALHRDGRLREAARWLRQAARLAPGERRVLHRLGRCLADQGDATGALAWYRRALAQPEQGVSDAELWSSVGHAQVDLGDFVAAEKAYERACILAPDDPDVFYHWAVMSARGGDVEGAERLALRARHLESRSTRSLLLLIRLALDRLDWQSAGARIEELGRLPDAVRLAQAYRAECALRRGHSTEARTLAIETLRMDGPPSDHAVDCALGTLRELHGREGPCTGYRLLLQARQGDQAYFRPYVVLAEDEAQARWFVAELQDSLDTWPWRILECGTFSHEGDAQAGVYQVLLTRVLFPAGETEGWLAAPPRSTCP